MFGYTSALADAAQYETKLAELTDMLHVACVTLEQNKISFQTDLHKWWSDYKEIVQDRANKREEADRQHMLRQQALAKLTVEERAALGLP